MEQQSENFVENVSPLVKEYEKLIDSLTAQVDYYKKGHESLKLEVTTLLEDNNVLSTKLSELLSVKTNEGSATATNLAENEFVENLRKQLGLSLQEKASAVELWQSALRTIDHLEEDLKVFQGRTHGFIAVGEVNKLKKNYEKQIKELELQLNSLHTNLQDTIQKSETNIKNKNSDLDKALQNQKTTFMIMKELEEEVRNLQKKQNEIMVMRDHLQNALHEKNNQIEDLKIKNLESKTKVNEALQVVEAALFEKDAALLRENQAKEESTKLSKTLSEIVNKAEEKVKTEVENTKMEYNKKQAKLLNEMKKVQEELSSKYIQLEKYTRECKLLEEEVERVKKGNIFIDDSNTSKLLILEKNLESTFQKLLLSERKNLQVMAERDGIKADLEQMACHFERDVKAREIEKRVLGHKSENLQKELELSNASLLHVAEKVDELNLKIKFMQGEIHKQLEIKDRTCKQKCNEKLKQIESNHLIIEKGLQNYLERQMALNEKWKTEVKLITDKLTQRINELHDETSQLRTANRKLTQKLAESEMKISEYQTIYDKFNTDSNYKCETIL